MVRQSLSTANGYVVHKEWQEWYSEQKQPN